MSDKNKESDVEQNKEDDIEENEVSETSQDVSGSHENKIPIKNKTNQETKDDQKEVRRSTRRKNINNKYFNANYKNNFVYVNYCDSNVPSTFEEARVL